MNIKLTEYGIDDTLKHSIELLDTAIGEGEPYALAALYLDHDVVDAVQAACKFSCFVSEPIVSFEVDI